MSPSILFWLDLSANLIGSLFALALLFLVLGAGLRQRLNQAFGLFIASSAMASLSFASARFAVWFDFGDPLFWSELATTGFYFAGPTLLAFALVSVDSEVKRYKVVVLVGFVIGLALIPALFNHHIISQAYLGKAELFDFKVTDIGYAAITGPLLFQALAFMIFWQNGQQLDGLALAVGTALLMLGGILGFLLHMPLPALSFAFTLGILILGYDVMSRQRLNPLWVSIEQLEAEVAHRTHELQRAKDKAQRLHEGQRYAAQISHEIAPIADSTTMLTRLVELIHAYLGYHHVYVYQPDNTGQCLIIRAAAGTTARTVMRSGHQLEIGGHSLAGHAASARRPQAAEARGNDAVYFEGTALPGARAEIALPLLIGDRLLGVLDLQSIHFEAFSDEDLIVMTSLADQVAVLLDNARLRQEMKVALAEVDKIQRQYLQQAWRAADNRPETPPACVYSDRGGVTPTSLTAAWSPEISRAAIEGQVLTNERENVQSTVALPIALRDQVIGALQVRHKKGRAWQPEDIETLGEIAERLGLALEAARLSEENQRRAAREQLISGITARMHETLDVDTVLQTAAREMGRALGLHDVTIRLEMEEEQTG